MWQWSTANIQVQKPWVQSPTLKRRRRENRRRKRRRRRKEGDGEEEEGRGGEGGKGEADAATAQRNFSKGLRVLWPEVQGLAVFRNQSPLHQGRELDTYLPAWLSWEEPQLLLGILSSAWSQGWNVSVRTLPRVQASPYVCPTLLGLSARSASSQGFCSKQLPHAGYLVTLHVPPLCWESTKTSSSVGPAFN